MSMPKGKFERIVPTFIALSKEVSQNPPLTPVKYDVALAIFPDVHSIDVRVGLTVRAEDGAGPTIRAYLGIPGMNILHLREVNGMDAEGRLATRQAESQTGSVERNRREA